MYLASRYDVIYGWETLNKNFRDFQTDYDPQKDS